MTMLSAIDAFFVAYQESSGVLMQMGVEVELHGRITRVDIDRMLLHIVKLWPPLGQRLRRDWLGLSWEGKPRVSEMLRVAENRDEWRNRPLNPFRETPFQVHWIEEDQKKLLAFRAQHAVVDGEGFFEVCAEALRALAGKKITTDQTDLKNGSSRIVGVRDALQRVQQLREEARSDKSARIAVRSNAPGPIGIVERDLDRSHLDGWLCASAWMKAIHRWNLLCDPTATSLISLEVPVSLRRNRDRNLTIGNQISPLVLYGDARQPLADLAQQLRQQMSRALRQQTHLALPSLAAPAKFLPWGVLRLIAASPELTGFATSHFAWLEHAQTIHDDVSRASNGALQLVNQQLYTPVCLHMGAAVTVLAWPERAQLFLTHRLHALATSDANVLLDLMVQELGAQHPGRQQVAV
jgi:hypothetical protein